MQPFRHASLKAPTLGARRHARGFTLVELVVVIVVLGVLAATVLPRFLALSDTAAAAAVESLAGAVRTAANQWRMVCIVKNVGACSSNSGVAVITQGGVTMQMWNGWPDAGDNLNNNEIDVAVRTSGFTLSISAGRDTVWRFAAAANPAACAVRYTEALTANSEPTVSVDTSGC